METLVGLGAEQLAAAMAAYRDALRDHQDAINRLNVYPVPDGDTGTNMTLTLESVVAELETVPKQDVEAVAKAISHGSLMGARGNSGVILSQILRGFAEAFRANPDGGADAVIDGLDRATSGAYGAVMRPVEGTILSVTKAAWLAAAGAAGRPLVETLETARAEAGLALDRTPDQLPVLKEAGVVDAGGAGFVLLLDALLHVVDGRPLPEPALVTAATPARDDLPVAPDHDPVGDLRYEVMYFLECSDEAIPAFRDVWAGVGDSIVVVGGDGVWNCHIHTDDIGAAIEAGLDCGRPRKIRVTDLFEQVEEERWVRDAARLGEPEAAAPTEPVACAVVAVATGPGLRRIFHSLGVHHIVAGGQTMNPATAELLEAIASVPAPEVIVLPNNKNIVAVAEQAAAVADKTVRVVPTRGIAEGFAALLEYDPQASAADNATNMAASAERVVAGEITQAVRDSTSEAGPIRRGDYIGLSRSGIEVVGPGLTETACDLLAKLVEDSHEIVTIIEGEGSTKADTRGITEWLEEHRPGVSPEVHHGGQPLYPYLFSIE
jgi:DAK2 domain fusion protein YloV